MIFDDDCLETYCEKLVLPLKGSIESAGVMMMISGLVLTVRCDLGFYFRDKSISKILQCQESGSWNDTLEAACEREKTRRLIPWQ